MPADKQKKEEEEIEEAMQTEDQMRRPARLLFTQRIGNRVLPMSFYVPVGERRRELAKLITDHGGALAPSYTADGFNLWYAKGKPRAFRSNRYYNADYVTDAITMGHLPSSKIYAMFDTEDLGSLKFVNSSSRPLTQTARRLYTKEEDRLIIDYMCAHPDIRWGGTNAWKDMAESLGGFRTWESLRNRYHKRLSKLYPVEAVYSGSFGAELALPAKIALETLGRSRRMGEAKMGGRPRSRSKKGAKRGAKRKREGGKSGIDKDLDDDDDDDYDEDEYEDEEDRDGVERSAGEKGAKRMRSESESESLEDIEPDAEQQGIIERMVEESGYSLNIVLHALIVHTGNVRAAMRYLRNSNTPDEMPWTVPEDQMILQCMDDDGPRDRQVKKALAKCAYARGLESLRRRFSFIDIDYDSEETIAVIKKALKHRIKKEQANNAADTQV